MKWVKASERLPEYDSEEGQPLFVNYKNTPYRADYKNRKFVFTWGLIPGAINYRELNDNEKLDLEQLEWLDESPIKEDGEDELWEVVSKIIHSTHRMEDALGKLNCQFHITRKTPNQ